MPQHENVFLIGPESSGKTSFLGGLALLGDARKDSGVSLIGLRTPSETDTNSAQEFLTEIRRVLHSQEWPPATTRVSFFRYRVFFRRHVLDLAFLDYPGEEMREALNLLAPKLMERVIEHLHAAHVLILLLDPLVDLPGLVQRQSDEIIHGERLQAHINALHEILNLRGSDSRFPAVGIAVPKADLCPELQDLDAVREYIERTMKPFVDRVTELSGAPPRYFSFSSVGKVEEVTLPDGKRHWRPAPFRDLKPFGYAPLLDWIVLIQTQRRWRPYRRAALILVPFLIFIGIALGFWQSAEVNDIRNAALPLDERLKAARRVPVPTGTARNAVDALVTNELSVLRARLSEAKDQTTAMGIEESAKRLIGLRFSTMDKTVEEFRDEARTKMGRMEFDAILGMPLGRERRERLKTFVGKHKEAADGHEAQRELDKEVKQESDGARKRISSYKLTDNDSLRGKAEEIRRYVTDFGEYGVVQDPEQVLKAVTVAFRLAGTGQFAVTVESAGKLNKGRSMMVKFWSLIPNQPNIQEIKAKATVTDTREFDRNSFDLKWSVGVPIKVELLADTALIGSEHETIATKDSDGPLGILLLFEDPENGILLIKNATGIKYIADTAIIRVKVRDFSKEDAQLLREYIYPGGKW